MVEDAVVAQWLRRLTVIAVVSVLVLLAFEVLQPFLVPVIWAAILAYVTWPLHQRALKVCRDQRDVAAFLMTVLLSVCIVLPVVWLAVLVQAWRCQRSP